MIIIIIIIIGFTTFQSLCALGTILFKASNLV